MKTLALILGMLITGFLANAQDTEGVNVMITIDNIRNDQGKILAALHSEQTFMKGPGLYNYSSNAQAGTITFTFENVAPGTYAFSSLHDENGNQQMDFEDNGMPRESYGVSGNAPMGPPTFKAAKFEVVDENLELNIRF